MKRFLLIAFVAAVLVGSSAQAAVYYFTPPQPDLQDLDHNDYKSWGIDWSSHTGERIVGATLTFKNIWDWTVERDHLYIHLLNDPRLGIRTYYDGERQGDNWAGRGLRLADWSDPYGGRPRQFDLVIDLNEMALGYLNRYAADGRFGFGFDPDCHYYNDGVEFRVETAAIPTPEPATVAIFSLGLAGIGILRRRKI